MIRLEHYQYSFHKNNIQFIYEKSFPQSERFDFNILKRCNKELNVHLSGIVKDDETVGMQFTVDIPNDITYLMYFAIDDLFRNQGIGSKALQNLIVSKEKVMLIIERPIDEITQRRKEFYLRNGLYETGIYFEDTDVQYEVLISCKDYKPTVQDLLNRYKFMTSRVSTWHKIKHTFNAEYIKFVD